MPARTPTYPDVVVQLTGNDGNAMSIMSRVSRALKAHGLAAETVQDFRDEATAGDYDNLLRVVQKWVTVQ